MAGARNADPRHNRRTRLLLSAIAPTTGCDAKCKVSMSLATVNLTEATRLAFQARPLRPWLWIALLALTAAAPYLPTLRYGFVYDDRPQIVDNPELLSPRNIPRLFSESISKAVGFHNTSQPVFYRPLFFTQLCLTRTLFGPGPLGFHLVSLLFQIGNTWLLYFMAVRLRTGRAPAFLAGMIFAVHPVHVESVVWPSASPDLMVLAGILGSLLAFLIGEGSLSRGARLGWRVSSLIAFLGALFVKETALVALPLLAAISLSRSFSESLVSYGPAKTSVARRRTADLAPYIGIAVFYLAVRAHVLHGMVATVTPASWADMARTWPSVLWFYERHLILPMRTSLLYDYDLVPHATMSAFWIPLAAVCATSAAFAYLLWRRRSLAVVIASLLLVLPILLVLNFRVFYWGDLVHDRYLYVPSAGFCMLAAMGLCRVGERFRGTIGPVAQRCLAAALLGGLGLITIAQAQPWRNNLLLLVNAAEVAPRNIAAQILLGDELESRNQFAEAEIFYQRAVALTPAWGPAWFAYGRTLLLTHDAQDAIQSLQQAIRLDPSPIARVWLAVACEQAGRAEEARSALAAALAQDPSMTRAYADVENKLRLAAHK